MWEDEIGRIMAPGVSPDKKFSRPHLSGKNLLVHPCHDENRRITVQASLGIK
jgi:hypothetical protein